MSVDPRSEALFSALSEAGWSKDKISAIMATVEAKESALSGWIYE